MSRPSSHPVIARRLFLGAALTLALHSAHAQSAVTSWVLSNSNAANNTAYTPTITFDNQKNTVTSITTSAGVQTISSTAENVYIRRSSAAGNNANLWEVATADGSVSGQNTSTMTLQNILTSNNALMGVNDLFTNTGGSPAPANNNVERVDYVWNTGFAAVATDGFAIFDRAANHDAADGFQIAVITARDGANTPTTYGGNVVEVVAGATSKYSATGLDYDPLTAGAQTGFGYQILRFTNTNDLSTLNQTSYSATQQGIFGVFITFADLGIANGTTVYGYSIMANDVTNVTANLTNWNNTTYYPTTTPDSGTSGGSIDFLAVNGNRFVPEPSTYGAIFVGSGLAFFAWRRRKHFSAQR